MGKKSKKLGATLKQVRETKGLSLAAVAEPAGMSATYLQKLERGEVESPSPHRLHALGDKLELSYADLMAAAGYVVPAGGPAPKRGTASVGRAPAKKDSSRRALLKQALSSDDVTEEELADLAEYLAFKRQQAKRHS